MTAPKPNRPDALLKLSEEDRQKAADEVRFIDYSASLPFRTHQELIKINHTLDKIEGQRTEMDYQTQETLRRIAVAQELTLLASLGLDVTDVFEVKNMMTRYGVTP